MPLQQGDKVTPFIPIPANLNGAEIKSLYLHESRSALVTYRQSGSLQTNVVPVPNAQTGNGLPGEGNAVAEQKEKKFNAPTAIQKLYTVTPTSPYGAIENTLLILLRLKESPDASMKQLRKVTGLSEDGMVKRIMAMKKAGLIVRAPHKRLLYLTPKAKQMLEEAKI